MQRSLTTSCLFYEQTQETRAKSTSQQQFPIFSTELSRMKRSVELLSRATRRIDSQTATSLAVYTLGWFSQQPTLTFLHPPYFAMRKLKCSIQDRQQPFSEFHKTAAVETFARYRSFLKLCLLVWFMFIEFVFKLVVACSFLVARVIKNTRRKPFEFTLYPQSDNKQHIFTGT